MRRKFVTALIGVCLVVCAVLAWHWHRSRWGIVKAQSEEGNLLILYASYQFNTLKQPTGLALMTDTYNGVSTLYIADSGNHVIRRFAPGGPLTTIGTIGTPGYVDGSMSNVKFNYPTGLSGRVETGFFVDPFNYQYYPYYQHIIYVGDTQNYVIRKFCTQGSVTPRSTPQGVSPCFAIVETVCGSHNQGMADGSSSSASFASLAGVSLDGSNEYYIADAGNHSIREWDGVNVSTVAGNGSPGFVDGNGSAARFMVPGKTTRNPSGYLWVADIGNNAIRGIDAGDNVVTCAGAGPSQPGYVDGQGSQAQFNRPTSVFFNAADNLVYIADSHNNVIRRMDSSGNVTTYAGTGTPGLVNGSLTQAQFDKPTDIVIKNGFMYVSDTMNNVIRRIDMVNGVVTTYIS